MRRGRWNLNRAQLGAGRAGYCLYSWTSCGRQRRNRLEELRWDDEGRCLIHSFLYSETWSPWCSSAALQMATCIAGVELPVRYDHGNAFRGWMFVPTHLPITVPIFNVAVMSVLYAKRCYRWLMPLMLPKAGRFANSTLSPNQPTPFLSSTSNPRLFPLSYFTISTPKLFLLTSTIGSPRSRLAPISPGPI